jgi:hypothetical protein
MDGERGPPRQALAALLLPPGPGGGAALEGKIHRVGADFGSTLKVSLIGILSRTAGSTGKVWAHPVNFRFGLRPNDFAPQTPRARGGRQRGRGALPPGSPGAGSDLPYEVHRGHRWKLHRNHRNGVPWHPLP